MRTKEKYRFSYVKYGFKGFTWTYCYSQCFLVWLSIFFPTSKGKNLVGLLGKWVHPKELNSFPLVITSVLFNSDQKKKKLLTPPHTSAPLCLLPSPSAGAPPRAWTPLICGMFGLPKLSQCHDMSCGDRHTFPSVEAGGNPQLSFPLRGCQGGSQCHPPPARALALGLWVKSGTAQPEAFGCSRINVGPHHLLLTLFCVCCVF